METQNFKNHGRLVTGYHKVLYPMLLAGVIGSCINLSQSCANGNCYAASLILLLFITVILTAYFSRSFALKAQDRAIRAEENMRHFLMTEKPLPSALTTRQIIGLRFASDEEFLELIKETIENNLNSKQIKAKIKNWKADHYRV
jgi:hypothetical protein